MIVYEVVLAQTNVRYWHLADIGLRGVNLCLGGKAVEGAGQITIRQCA